MKPACTRFRAELERVSVGPSGQLERLARNEHALACDACRAELNRETSLEHLLARDAEPAVPAGLSQRVLLALAAERGGESRDELDELLERVPAPQVPVGLARRTLEGVAHARRSRRHRAPWLALAAAVLAGLGLWTWSALRTPPAEIEPAVSELESDPELLAYVMEQWELLHDEDLDIWLASLDPTDELLLEYADGEIWPEELETAPIPEGEGK